MKKLSPARIVAVFVFVSVIWIVVSDILLLRNVSTVEVVTTLSIVKGWLYIAVTAIFLYILIRRYAAQRGSAENDLSENRAMLANILDTVPQSVFWKDRDSVYLGCNRVFARAAGVENPEQIIGKTDFDLPWPPEEAEAYRADDREVMKNKQPKFHIIEPLEQADGTRLWIDTTKLPLTDKTGHVYGVLGVFEDITERKRAEEEHLSHLRFLESLELVDRAIRQADRVELMLTDVLDAALLIFESDRAWLIYPCDPAAQSWKVHMERTRTEYPGALAIGTDLPTTPEVGQAFLEALNSSGPVVYDPQSGRSVPQVARQFSVQSEIHMVVYPKIGKPWLFGMHQCSYARVWSEKDLRLFTEIARRIADGLSSLLFLQDLQKSEDQLRQSQKMEAVGHLAGGIAHDFNNILTVITGFGDMVKMRIKDDAILQGYMNEILRGADRAADLTRGLLAFSRKQVIRPMAVNLNEIVIKMEKMLRRIIGEDIEFSTVLWKNDITVMVDTAQLDQVLLNLTTNARDAMPAGGHLIIGTEVVNVDNSYAEIHLFEKTGKYGVVAVSDTGTGMDPKTRENIFEPFFTTKEVGKGTGLGLAIVYGIVKQHGGNINVYSEPGKGTTFRIYLPMVQAAAEKAEQPVLSAPQGKGETILIAEDDAKVRDIVRIYLRENGYKVVEAVNGDDAVRKFKENADKVSVLLFDVIMPVKNGRDAYAEIKGTRPDIKAIFMSGYADDIIASKGLLEDGFEFISKPIDINALLRKIRDVLEEEKNGNL